MDVNIGLVLELHTGQQAREVFMKSKLPMETLHQVW